MIPKPFNDIAEDDLVALVSNAVSEGRTIEYKRELPSNGDGDKKEFLADVSSFSNSGGGDLIFGMEEDRGVPTQIVAIQAADLDLEIRRLESILGAGLDPRIRYSLKVVTCQGGCRVLIIRVERSWVGPHRVIFKGHDRFYGRNSAGKYPLDVNELRAAFTLPATVIERIRAFRTDRIIAISNNQTTVRLPDSPKIVLHCIPIESFAGQPQYDMLPFYQNPLRFRPIDVGSGWDRRLNLEGLVAFSGNQPSYTYAQLYRNGVIEAVDGIHLACEHNGKMVIPSISYEKQVFEYLPACLKVQQEMGVNVPVAVGLTLTNTRGLQMGVDSYGFEVGYPIESDTVILPETMVSDFSMATGKILKPLFDLVWNSCGYPASKNFDAESNWVDRRGT